jgi:hypothetical protein
MELKKLNEISKSMNMNYNSDIENKKKKENTEFVKYLQ